MKQHKDELNILSNLKCQNYFWNLNLENKGEGFRSILMNNFKYVTTCNKIP